MTVSVSLWLDVFPHIMSQLFYVYHFIAYWINLNAFHSWTGKKKKKKTNILIQVEFWWHFCVFLSTVPVNWVWVIFFQPVYLPLPDSGFDTELLRQAKELEVRGVSAAEAGDLQAALQLFSQAIQILPQRASAYNNRAQALRLQGNTAGTCRQPNNNPLPTHQSPEFEASMTSNQRALSISCTLSAVVLHWPWARPVLRAVHHRVVYTLHAQNYKVFSFSRV